MSTKLLLLALLPALALAGDPFGVPQKYIDKLASSSFFSTCWGKESSKAYHKWIMESAKKCQQLPSPHDEDLLFGAYARSMLDCGAPRMKKAMKDDEELRMFMDNLAKLKQLKIDNLGNLTCVMKETSQWKADGSVNVEFYTKTMWEEMEKDESIEQVEESFKEEMIKRYSKCEKVMKAVPELPEDAPPYKKMFAKQIVFQNCALVMSFLTLSPK